MNWFKHHSNLASTEDISMLLEEFGPEGYGIFWLIVEKIASNYDGKNEPTLTFSEKVWAKICRISVKKLKKFLNFATQRENFISEKPLFFVKFSQKNGQNLITINYPKLLKNKDEYTRKKSKMSGQYPDSIRTHIVSGQTPDNVRTVDIDKEIDIEKEKEKKNIKRKEKIAEPSQATNRPTLPSPEILIQIYNEENRKLPGIRAVTPQRLKKCSTRLKNFSDDIDTFLKEFRKAVRKAQHTPFLYGENRNGWTASFDWFVANDENFLKVLEGKYDKSKVPQNEYF